MAASTGQARMLAFENIAGKFVIECFRIPLNERKVFPVMLGVATGTLLARSLGDVVGGVQTLVRGDARPDFSVAFDALQGGAGAKFMTSGTVGCARKRLVCPRSGPGEICAQAGAKSHRKQNVSRALSKRCASLSSALCP